MIVTDHARMRLYERVTWMDNEGTYQFFEKEIRCGKAKYSVSNPLSKRTLISNKGITYIIDNTTPEDVVITVYLTEEEMSEYEHLS